jgi:penicillin-binding protein 1A
MIIALKLEQRFSKDEILTFYLNEVFFGRNSYGVEAAALTYFGKHVSDLSLGESALLAGLPQRPSAYAPQPGDTEAAEGRRKVVLDSMLESGFISMDEYERAALEPIEVMPVREASYKGLEHPYYTTYVINEVKEILGHRALLFNGLNIYTTIDLEMQASAERILPEKVAEFESRNISQGALMTIDPKTGAVLAVVGGVDFNQSELNRAWQANRQPGSAFKPFVYLKAIEQGYSPSSLIVDEKMVFRQGIQTYTPKNYDHAYQGVMTAREALAKSRNICAVKTIDIVGPGEVVQLCRRLGFESALHPYLSLGLGSSEVTLEEMCAAYGTFANDGIYNEPFSVIRITDATGRELYRHRADPEQAVKANDARLLNVMTQAVVQGGTGWRAKIPGRHIAGKTGTTSEYSDAWFAGYAPNLCTVVWVGNDRVVDFMKRVTGGQYPAVIWHDYMVEAFEGYPVEEFPKPMYPSRARPLDKERTSSELEAMLQLQIDEEEREKLEEEGESDVWGLDGDYLHPWERETSEEEEEGGDDEGEDEHDVYF